MTQDELRSLLNYSPETGELTRRSNGKPALATRHVRGYRHGSLGGQHYLAHRIIWKWMTGEEPQEIDHINGDKSDNRWNNLRSVSRLENTRNLPRQRTDKTLPACVFKQKNRYRVRIRHNGQNGHFGSFLTVEEAVAARDAAWREIGFHENHGRELADV